MTKKLFVLALLLLPLIAAKATVSGPWPITYQIDIPQDQGKVVVYSNPMFSGGHITLKNVSTNEVANINASVTYQLVWYYIISQGDWEVTSIDTNYDVTIDGVSISIGDIVPIDAITTIVFYPNN